MQREERGAPAPPRAQSQPGCGSLTGDTATHPLLLLLLLLPGPGPAPFPRRAASCAAGNPCGVRPPSAGGPLAVPRWARRSPQPPLLSCGTGAVLGVPEVLPLGIPAPTAPLSQGNAEGTVPTPGWVLRKGRGGAPVPISPTHALGEHKPRRCFKVGDFLRWGGGWVKPSGSTLCEGKAALTPHLESSDWFRKVAPRAGQGWAPSAPSPWQPPDGEGGQDT